MNIYTYTKHFACMTVTSKSSSLQGDIEGSGSSYRDETTELDEKPTHKKQKKKKKKDVDNNYVDLCYSIRLKLNT